MLISHITPEQVGKEITLSGWVVHARASGKICFVELRDGSGFMQCVAQKNPSALAGTSLSQGREGLSEEKFALLSSLNIESSLSLTGTVSKHPKKDEFELQVSDVVVYCKTQDYPLGQKEHNADFLFDMRHLYLRAPSQRAIQRIRNTIINATYTRFAAHDFIKIDAPIFTPSACEGTTELYEVEHVNGEKMYLSQSGQLYLEAAIAAHGRVFDFGPTFRAEKSKTRRHLNEFWMMDAEMAFVDSMGSLEIQEQLIYSIIHEVLRVNRRELGLLERDVSKLEVIKPVFLRKRYVDVIAELQKMGSDIKEGDDLGADDETMLMNTYDQPMFVMGYPSHVKAFYMKENPENPGYVKNADLLAPEGVGEVIGGSEREADYDVLLRKIKEHKLPIEFFDWYLDTRKYGGVPHSGFGYGLERIVRWLCGLHHIRETIPFPRYANRIRP